ncbi:hypothetical protein AAL_08277 [Moelleriella libera RCEF 2490]|uniref:Calcineurin-like phosphoesterase domain-containing protein n=1 Tax=Moelleriella libera RCEF 2490 TaxID=1081109 RepID=A0A167VNA8_9HYPO|nr:hypothetical protein AAL_08277 [Moelleriella libera RCEF 2490]
MLPLKFIARGLSRERASTRAFGFASFNRQCSSQKHQTSVIILSDTHGDDLKHISLPKADVVLHCGDLTNESRFAELERTIKMLRAIEASLKLVIPGNHDFGLEPGYKRWTRLGHPHGQHQDEQGGFQSTDEADDTRASWALLRHASQHDSIFLLPQGLHTFVLPADQGGTSARLRLFASPLTPRGGNWGFQYDRSNPHRWDIPHYTIDTDSTVDAVMTHGPPRGIRDIIQTSQYGCARLLAAVERARPLLHCFGHIHASWGAEIVAWKRDTEVSSNMRDGAGAPTYDRLVNARQSRVIASLPPSSHAEDCCSVDISPTGAHSVRRGRETLFVNAALGFASARRSTPLPWLVKLHLPAAGAQDVAAAQKTMQWLLP